MNASVRGPFLPAGFANYRSASPTYCPSSSSSSACASSSYHGMDWLDYFLRQLTPRDRLVGTTVNCRPRDAVRGLSGKAAKGTPPYDAHATAMGAMIGLHYPQLHMQSMFLVLDWSILHIILQNVPCGPREVAIFDGEIMLTQGILRAGYGIRPQMLFYSGIQQHSTAHHNGVSINNECALLMID